jgi:hypothetical protein
MNEEQLKEIWKREKAENVLAVDFERVQKDLFVWQGKLRRKIKLDILANVLVYIFLIPVFIILPKLLYLSPFLILVWIWYLWETLRIYKQETNFGKFGNTRDYLANKKKLLENFSTRTRYIVYIGVPLIGLQALYVLCYLDKMLEEPLVLMAVLIFDEIFISILTETYLRKVYAPSINELKDLLQQLESDE